MSKWEVQSEKHYQIITKTFNKQLTKVLRKHRLPFTEILSFLFEHGITNKATFLSSRKYVYMSSGILLSKSNSNWFVIDLELLTPRKKYSLLMGLIH